MLACAILCGSLGQQAFIELRPLGRTAALASAILVAGFGFFAMAAIARVVRPGELLALFRDRA
jgi:hypothetical protein